MNVIQSDWGYLLSFSLQDSQGNVFDLTSNTGVLFRAQRNGVTKLKFSGTMTVKGLPTAGTCTYTVAQTDFDMAGLYNAEIQVSFGSEVVTFSNISVSASPKVPY